MHKIILTLFLLDGATDASYVGPLTLQEVHVGAFRDMTECNSQASTIAGAIMKERPDWNIAGLNCWESEDADLSYLNKDRWLPNA